MPEEVIVSTAVAFWMMGVVSIVLFAIGIGAVVWGFATGEIKIREESPTSGGSQRALRAAPLEVGGQGPDDEQREVGSTLPRPSPRLERRRRQQRDGILGRR